MIYITAKEVFPEAYSEGKHTQSTVAFLVGLLLMLLDIVITGGVNLRSNFSPSV